MKLFAPLAVLGLLFCLAVELPAQSVRVVFVSGEASIQRPEEPALRPAVKGETIIIGTRIVTGADGRLVLTPMPGIKSIVTPNTTLLLEGVSENRTSDTNVTQKVVLDLKEGSVVSDLQKPEGVTYDYSIRTARGLAGARGTTYTVGINSAGIQTIVVAHGAISINFSDGRKMTLTPGQLSVTKSNGQTQKVEKLDQLSPEDQKVAQKGAETTIAAIATAIDAGISVAPEALNNALAAAKGLGVTLSPETQKAVSGALDTSDAPPPEKQPGDAPAKDEPKPGDPKPGEPKPGDPKPGDGPVKPDGPPPILPPGPTPPPPPPPNIKEITAKSPLDLFLERLPGDLHAPLRAQPGDIQNLLIALNEIDIAAFVLKPDPDTGVAYTLHDLRTHLAAFKDLKQSNAGAFAMVKDMAGPDLVNMPGTPDPLQWSAGAFARTLASWNALTDAKRALIIDLGAGEAIMDTSPDYIQALLGQLTATDIALIKATGWGRYLADLAGNPATQTILNLASTSSAAQLAIIKDFDVSPQRLVNGTTINTATIAAINALASATVSDADRLLMRQLGVGQRMLYETGTPPRSFSQIINSTIAFYGSLTPAEQTAARALDLGDIFYKNVPTAIFGSSTRTFLQRVQDLTAFYNTHPNLQQSLQDSRILSFDLLPTDFVNASGGSHLSLVDTLALFDALPTRTRTYLDVSYHDGDFNFYELANPLIAASPYLRPLGDINTLLTGLTPGQFSSLLDLDLSTAVFEVIPGPIDLNSSNPLDANQATDLLGANPLATLQATIATYEALPPFHKQVLRELGIIGDGNTAVIGADTQGLDRLLSAYAALPAGLRATTDHLDELAASNHDFGDTTTAVPARSFFFTGNNLRSGVPIIDIQFHSTGDLYVGATRFLQIANSSLGSIPVFDVGAGHDLYLHASDLIELTGDNSTGTMFSNGIRSITMAAATINLTNINFPAGSVASLNSKFLGVNFISGSTPPTPGLVNFKNVSYGGAALANTGDLSATAKANGNIAIGTLAAPATLPTHVAQGTTRTAP